VVEPTEISPGRDEWAEWLADRRFGGDPETRRRFQRELDVRRDKVLDLARLREGETVLDVGCGEGLIAFGALERGAGSVIFSDISVDLLNLCREAATALGVVDRCRFVQASADKLDPISDTAVDVVTTRSVLIYVSDKPAAFREFAGVLRPGGRIAIFEPINRFAVRTADTWAGYDLTPLGDLGPRLCAVYDAVQPRDFDPMRDFDERDLIRLADDADFLPDHPPPRRRDHTRSPTSLGRFPQQLPQSQHPNPAGGDGASIHPRRARTHHSRPPATRRGRLGHPAHGLGVPQRHQTVAVWRRRVASDTAGLDGME